MAIQIIGKRIHNVHLTQQNQMDREIEETRKALKRLNLDQY